MRTGTILILGGGFAGVRAALDLEKTLGARANIILVDKNPYHLFLPALYEVAAAYGAPRDPYTIMLRRTVAIPFKEIFEGKRITHIQASVLDGDIEKRIIRTDTGVEIPYDFLIVGLGSEAADFGVPGVTDYAYGFKTLDDAIAINTRLTDLFQEAERGERRLPIRVLVCGAGFTGIETATEIGSCVRKFARECKLRGQPTHIMLFDANPDLLPHVSDGERERIKARLTARGVALVSGARVASIEPSRIHLADGRSFDGDIIIWTTGVRAPRVLDRIHGLDLTPQGKMIVGEQLNMRRHPTVFGVGDAIHFIDHATQKPIPAMAYLAMDHGKVAAQNILRMIEGKELRTHKPSYSIWVAPVGGKYAVARLPGGIIFGGFAAWLFREFIDLNYFISILPFKKALALFWREIKVFTANDL